MAIVVLPEPYKPPILATLLLVLGLGALTASGYIYWQHLTKKAPVQQADKQEMSQGQGGRGGNASVGGSGVAIGGPGGNAGERGRGGDGGSAHVAGDGYAAGGAGGHVAKEGVWSPPAKSGYEILQRTLGLPVDPNLRQYGRGGAMAGYEPKLKIIEELRLSYFRAHSQAYQTIFQSVHAVPLDYLNNALASAGEEWRVRIVDEDEYEFFIPK